MNAVAFLSGERLIVSTWSSVFYENSVASYFMSQNVRGLEGSKVARWGSHLRTYKEYSTLCFRKAEKKQVFNEVSPLSTTVFSPVLTPAIIRFYKCPRSEFLNMQTHTSHSF